MTPHNYVIEKSDLSKRWYKNGRLHREDGPAIEWSNGSKVWIKNGLTHRKNGPAVEYANGGKKWYKNGKLHREDGPAIEYADGAKYWYIENNRLTKEAFAKAIKAKATATCDGKYVEVDGIQYKLVKI